MAETLPEIETLFRFQPVQIWLLWQKLERPDLQRAFERRAVQTRQQKNELARAQRRGAMFIRYTRRSNTSMREGRGIYPAPKPPASWFMHQISPWAWLEDATLQQIHRTFYPGIRIAWCTRIGKVAPDSIFRVLSSAFMSRFQCVEIGAASRPSAFLGEDLHNELLRFLAAGEQFDPGRLDRLDMEG